MSYWRGSLSTVDLLVLTSLAQLLFQLKILIHCFSKQVTLMRGSTVLSLPPQLVFLGKTFILSWKINIQSEDEIQDFFCVNQGNTNWRGRLNTVVLLIKLACLVKKFIMFAFSKGADQYKEVNFTKPSPNVSVFSAMLQNHIQYCIKSSSYLIFQGLKYRQKLR